MFFRAQRNSAVVTDYVIAFTQGEKQCTAHAIDADAMLALIERQLNNGPIILHALAKAQRQGDRTDAPTAVTSD